MITLLAPSREPVSFDVFRLDADLPSHVDKLLWSHNFLPHLLSEDDLRFPWLVQVVRCAANSDQRILVPFSALGILNIVRARISRRHSWLLRRGEDRVDGLLVQSCDELSLFVETLSMFVVDRLRCLRRNASKLLDDDKQPAALLQRETMVAELAVVRQLKTASISRLGSARELRRSRAIDLSRLVVALLRRDRDAMLVCPSLVTNAALGVLIEQ